jgi:hypothetical protein
MNVRELLEALRDVNPELPVLATWEDDHEEQDYVVDDVNATTTGLIFALALDDHEDEDED